MANLTGNKKLPGGEPGDDNIYSECQTNYEKLMDPHFYSAESATELEKCHIIVKNQVTEEMSQKLVLCFESAAKLEELTKKLSADIDTTFGQLRKHFEAAKIRDQNRLLAQTAQKEALSAYDNDMEKFLQNNPHISPKDVFKQHALLLTRASRQAKRNGGVAMTSQLLNQLKDEIEQRRVFFTELAKMNSMSIKDGAIGIDLGTTMCCVSVYYGGKIEIIPNRAQGNSNTTPSYVAYHANGKDTFGIVAKEEAYMYPETTIYDAKRMIGRPWTDEMLQADRENWQFDVVNDLGTPKVSTWGRTRYPHEVSAKLLHSLRLMADDYLGKPRGTIRKAVITVPAYFTEPQRRATNEAAMCAGLDVLNILSEPTAAAIAYNWQRRETGKRNILVYDLGGGTFDVSIARADGGDIEILGVDGDTHLGGHDFDKLLVDYCIQEFLKLEKVNLSEGKNSTQKFIRDDVRGALARLRLQCEKVKERLSSAEQSKVEVSRICGYKNLVIPITREKFNSLITPLVNKTMQIVERALVAAKSKGINGKDDIHDVILVGGSTRIPLVLNILKEYFYGKELSQYINPDEAVACGAAINAAILNKTEGFRNIVVSDVTPFSLGIEVIGKRFSRIIHKNSKIPCSYTEVYSTTVDGQTSGEVMIYQGEEEKSTDNKWLGNFLLEGLPPKPAGKEKARVTMAINEMGILIVDAVSVSTGNNNAVMISSERLGMDKDTMDRLREEFTVMEE